MSQLDWILEYAEKHGNDSYSEHEVGDLQDALSVAFRFLTESEKDAVVENLKKKHDWVPDFDDIAPNGNAVTPDENGRLRDVNGNCGYRTRLAGLWVCYTCGHLCECNTTEGDDK